jgi:hypothetical protein
MEREEGEGSERGREWEGRGVGGGRGRREWGKELNTDFVLSCITLHVIACETVVC